jgi:hypothetical protein
MDEEALVKVTDMRITLANHVHGLELVVNSRQDLVTRVTVVSIYCKRRLAVSALCGYRYLPSNR